MSRGLHYIERVIAPVARVMSNIGVVFVALTALLITADVAGRYFFDHPIKGAHEIIEFMVLGIVALGLAYTQYRKANIAIDLLVTRLPQNAQAAVAILAYFLSLGIISVIGWQAFIHTRHLWDTGQKSLELHIPTAPFQFILAFGFLMLWLVLLLDFLYSVSKAVRR